MNTETIVNIVLAFCFGIPIALVITPIFVYLKKVMYHPFLNKKLLEKAIEDGHVVNVQKIKEHDIYNHTNNNALPTGEKIATYKYIYNGKNYKRRFMSFNYMADETRFYFISNPKKITSGGSLWTTAKNHWIRSFFLMILFSSIISWIILVFK